MMRTELDHGPARTMDELEQAYGLVYSNYLDMGLCDPHPSRMRYSLKNSLPEAVTFVAANRGVVSGTVTLMPDSPLGLPLDEVYLSQANDLRRQGRRIAEVTQLSDRVEGGSKRSALTSLLKLFKLAFDYCRQIGVDDILVTCNPKRHEGFYTRYLKFERFGPHVSLHTVNGSMATLVRLDIRDLDGVDLPHADLKRFFVEDPTPPEDIARRFRHTEETLSYMFLQQRPLLEDATPAELECIASRYPGVDIMAMMAQPVGAMPALAEARLA